MRSAAHLVSSNNSRRATATEDSGVAAGSSDNPGGKFDGPAKLKCWLQTAAAQINLGSAFRPKVVTYTNMKHTFIDRLKTALVAIDLQKGVVGRQTAPYAADIVVKNAAAIADACRKNGMPVFLVRVAFSPDGKDALRPCVDAPVPAQTPPPDWTDLVPEIGPKPGDFVITKHQWGAFYGTELDLELRRRGLTTILLCGIATNIGVESTARFAFEYGFHQIFVEDALAAMSAEEHTTTVTKIFPRIGLVRKTQEILADLLAD
jgi:nicotinamidase-related amidase